MRTIFELEAIWIKGERYPIRDTNLWRLGLFSSKGKAEKAMMAHIARTNDQPEEYRDVFLGYVLTERLIDECDDNDVFVCSYTSDGTFNDQNMMDNRRKFHGRPKERIRFSVGDIVEVYDGGSAELCIIAATPPTTEYFMNIKQKAEANMKKRGVEGYQYEMDDGDDQYMVYPVRGDYHMHIRSELVFNPTKKVSKALRKQLESQLNKTL